MQNRVQQSPFLYIHAFCKNSARAPHIPLIRTIRINIQLEDKKMQNQFFYVIDATWLIYLV